MAGGGGPRQGAAELERRFALKEARQVEEMSAEGREAEVKSMEQKQQLALQLSEQKRLGAWKCWC